MSKKSHILIVDDEESIRDSCRQVLMRAGFRVWEANDAVQGLQLIEEHPIDLVLLDLKLPRLNGMDALPRFKEKKPDIFVIVITGYATIES
ncbi:MAG: hybrid sensor histidine kinase/response regulator, partial [Candidatus Aminicenantes bacterium]